MCNLNAAHCNSTCRLRMVCFFAIPALTAFRCCCLSAVLQLVKQGGANHRLHLRLQRKQQLLEPIRHLLKRPRPNSSSRDQQQ